MQLVSVGSEPTQAKLSRKIGPVPWPKKALLRAVLSVGEGKGSYCDGLHLTQCSGLQGIQKAKDKVSILVYLILYSSWSHVY